MSESPWCSISEAAKYFQLTPKTLYSLIGRGRLPEAAVLRLGRQIRIDIRAVEASAAISGHGKGRRG